VQAEPVQAEPVQAEPVQAEPVHANGHTSQVDGHSEGGTANDADDSMHTDKFQRVAD